MFGFDLIRYAKRHKTWSWSTFGPPRESKRNRYYDPLAGDQWSTDCVGGIIDHIKKEVNEVETAPDREARRFEWVDIVILAMDGYLRDGGTPMGFALDLGQKQRINEQRKWPDWRQMEPGKAIEHVAAIEAAIQDDPSADPDRWSGAAPRTPSKVFFAPGILLHEFVGTGKRCDVCFAPREAEEHGADARRQN